MHCDTPHKGLFNSVRKHDIVLLKYDNGLIAYGEVLKTDTSDNDLLGDWNYAIYVDKWYYHNDDNIKKGVSRYGVQDATVAGDQFATVKEIRKEFAIKKMEEIKSSGLIKTIKNELLMEENTNKIIELLLVNYNLILTGAPGTGKTYLAQQIAKKMGCSEAQIGFVQFHPSYDYTDFVEGLRPKQDESGNIGFDSKDGIFKKFCEEALSSYFSEPDNAPKFVFIIDEINRGEISKIFGELFFSIDSGYRVTKEMIDDHKSGKSPLVTIRTQYSNMCKSPNAFDKALGITDINDFGHFFVPNNVYVIGTMNDIDRSVESMDFAFRRRFAFEEIKADENLGMLEGMADKEKIINRMTNLNAAIEKIEGLSSAYHIGGSYFMKLKLYQKEDKSYDFDSLWNNHLKVLLMEYLRGMPDIEKKIDDLEIAYKDDLKHDSSKD